jgi:hypothetical protein
VILFVSFPPTGYSPSPPSSPYLLLLLCQSVLCSIGCQPSPLAPLLFFVPLHFLVPFDGARLTRKKLSAAKKKIEKRK